MFELRRDDGLILSDDRDRLDLNRICAWLASSYWANDRDRDTIARSIAHSHPFGVYAEAGTQLAVARATTDYASFCWIGDVFVDRSVRGQGIGSWLVRAMVDHLRSWGVPRFLLGTRDAHGVYERIGFEALRVPQVYLEIDDRPNRPQATDVRRRG